MDKKDFSKIILDRSINKTGILKEESQLYEELCKYIDEEERKKTERKTARIIDFTPYITPESGTIRKENQIMFAAQNELPAQQTKPRSDFVVSDSNNLAIKFDINSNKVVSAFIISENEKEYIDAILWCRELNKNYIQNDKYCFNLGKFDSLDYSKLYFSLLLPIDSVIIINTGDNFVSTSMTGNITIEGMDEKDTSLELKINSVNSNNPLKLVVIESGNYKDFVTFNDSIISIPKSILSGKTTIYFY